MTAADRRATKTGGRNATTRHIPPRLALAVGMPSTPAPPGWRWSALTDIARLESGHTPSRKHAEYWGGTIPWIGIRDAKLNHAQRIEDSQEHVTELGVANSSTRVLPVNTVCLSRTASVGYVIVMGRPMATSQDFVNWVCGERLDHNFLKYLLIAEDDGLLRFASGSVHQTIYFPEVKAFYVCHPSVREQQRLVGILDEAFEGIGTARANAERSLQNVRALFESRLDGLFSQHRDGWVKKPLSKFAHAVSTGPFGSLLHKSDYVSDGVPIVNPINIVSGVLLPDKSKQISPATVGRLQNYVLQYGDVVVGRRGEIGRCAVVRRDEAGWICGTGCFFIRPLDCIDSQFLAHLIRSSGYREQLERVSTGATMKNLSNQALGDMVVAIPSLREQRDIVAMLESTHEETRRLESLYRRKLAALDELKQSLLHQAFTGAL